MHQDVDFGYEPVFENDLYAVVAVEADDLDNCLVRDGNPFAAWYEVVNTRTGIAEYKCPVMVECIFFAQQQMALFRDKSWEWYNKKGAGPTPASAAPASPGRAAGASHGNSCNPRY